MTLSEKICTCRRKQGLSQEALAAQLHVSRQAVSKWETGDAEPESGNLIALAQIFGVTVDWLLARGENPQEESDTSTVQGLSVPSAPKAKNSHKLFKNLMPGYFIYLGFLFLFLFFAMVTRCSFRPSFSWTLNFNKLIYFFDPALLSAMFIGCFLLLYGNKLLRPTVQAFRFVCFKKDCEDCSSPQIAQSRRAVWTALAGWILGGILYTVIYITNSLHSMSLSLKMSGSLLCILLNFLLYTIIALFISLPAAFSQKDKPV